jgi:hypothetical protein
MELKKINNRNDESSKKMESILEKLEKNLKDKITEVKENIKKISAEKENLEKAKLEMKNLEKVASKKKSKNSSSWWNAISGLGAGIKGVITYPLSYVM